MVGTSTLFKPPSLKSVSSVYYISALGLISLFLYQFLTHSIIDQTVMIGHFNMIHSLDVCYRHLLLIVYACMKYNDTCRCKV